MNNDTRNYYERELDLIDFNGKHPAKILIGSEGKTTRTLDINRESAAALVHRLTAQEASRLEGHAIERKAEAERD